MKDSFDRKTKKMIEQYERQLAESAQYFQATAVQMAMERFLEELDGPQEPQEQPVQPWLGGHGVRAQIGRWLVRRFFPEPIRELIDGLASEEPAIVIDGLIIPASEDEFGQEDK
jgi:hypothetical protein